MPNWVSSKLVISGDKEPLDELQAQMATPYETEYYNWKNNAVEPSTVEGVFLLWNAIRPTDLDAYYEREQTNERIADRNNPIEEEHKVSIEEVQEKIIEAVNSMPAMDSDEFQDDMAKMMEEMQLGMGWYNWNIRNWGTKWEISDNANVVSRTDKELTYEMQSAWSPPFDALDSLAKQYPTLAFTMKSLDENGCFACEAGWDEGKRGYELDLPITHEIKVELEGYCYVCDPDEGNLDDPDYDDAREELGCLVSATAESEAGNAQASL